MPIKIVRALRPQDNVSTEQFQKLWREQIGPHVASLQTSLNLIKYVQIHRAKSELDDSIRTSRPNLVQSRPPFDIVEELYFDGTMDDFVANYSSESGSKAWKSLRESGIPYLDLSECHIYIVEERPFVLPGSPDNLIASEYNHVFKVVALVDALDGDRSIEYWGRSHAALTQRWAPSLGILKYVQNHLYYPPVLDKLAEDFGAMKAPCDICAIMWYNARHQSDETSQHGMIEIREDEDSGFMTPNSMMCFAGKEYIFVDRYRT